MPVLGEKRQLRQVPRHMGSARERTDMAFKLLAFAYR